MPAECIRKAGVAAGRRRQTDRRRSKGTIFLFNPPENSLTLPSVMHAPVNIQLIGQEVAIIWDDGTESYYPFAKLRAASPSAETAGERDIFGTQYGGGGKHDYSSVQVKSWEQIGNYAIRFDFSDGHRTGLYAYDYLKNLAEKM